MNQPRSAITIDPAFFEDRDESMSVFVETDDSDNAARALIAASGRLQLVTFDGTEYPTEEEWSEADMASGGSFETTNANYIDDVHSGIGGAYLSLDTKDAAPAAMGRSVVRIVTEELERVGVDRAMLRTAQPHGWISQERHRSEQPIAAPQSTYRTAWFLIRQLYVPGNRATFRGIEFFREDGTWAHGQDGAVRRDEPELSQSDLDLCAALNDEPQVDGIGPPNWQRTLVEEARDDL